MVNGLYCSYGSTGFPYRFGARLVSHMSYDKTRTSHISGHLITSAHIFTSSRIANISILRRASASGTSIVGRRWRCTWIWTAAPAWAWWWIWWGTWYVVCILWVSDSGTVTLHGEPKFIVTDWSVWLENVFAMAVYDQSLYLHTHMHRWHFTLAMCQWACCFHRWRSTQWEVKRQTAGCRAKQNSQYPPPEMLAI